MYILRGRGKQIIGYYESYPDAMCAMLEELSKKDGQLIEIEEEGADDDTLRAGSGVYAQKRFDNTK